MQLSLDGFEHEGGVCCDSIEFRVSNLLQVGPARTVKHLSLAKPANERWAEVSVANCPPTPNVNVICIHVLASDVAIKFARVGVNTVFHELYNIAETDSCPLLPIKLASDICCRGSLE